MAQISRLKPGQVLWTVSRHKMGNTMVSTVSVHAVTVIEVQEGRVIASWNGNAARAYYQRDVSMWRIAKPATVRGSLGNVRLARRDELRALADRERQPSEHPAAPPVPASDSEQGKT